jgi:hypothetical protein
MPLKDMDLSTNQRNRGLEETCPFQESSVPEIRLSDIDVLELLAWHTPSAGNNIDVESKVNEIKEALGIDPQLEAEEKHRKFQRLTELSNCTDELLKLQSGEGKEALALNQAVVRCDALMNELIVGTRKALENRVLFNPSSAQTEEWEKLDNSHNKYVSLYKGTIEDIAFLLEEKDCLPYEQKVLLAKSLEQLVQFCSKHSQSDLNENPVAKTAKTISELTVDSEIAQSEKRLGEICPVYKYWLTVKKMFIGPLD